MLEAFLQTELLQQSSGHGLWSYSTPSTLVFRGKHFDIMLEGKGGVVREGWAC